MTTETLNRIETAVESWFNACIPSYEVQQYVTLSDKALCLSMRMAYLCHYYGDGYKPLSQSFLCNMGEYFPGKNWDGINFISNYDGLGYPVEFCRELNRIIGIDVWSEPNEYCNGSAKDYCTSTQFKGIKRDLSNLPDFPLAISWDGWHCLTIVKKGEIGEYCNADLILENLQEDYRNGEVTENTLSERIEYHIDRELDWKNEYGWYDCEIYNYCTYTDALGISDVFGDCGFPFLPDLVPSYGITFSFNDDQLNKDVRSITWEEVIADD